MRISDWSSDVCSSDLKGWKKPSAFRLAPHFASARCHGQEHFIIRRWPVVLQQRDLAFGRSSLGKRQDIGDHNALRCVPYLWARSTNGQGALVVAPATQQIGRAHV